MIDKLKFEQTTVDATNARYPQMNLQISLHADGFQIAGNDYSRMEVYAIVVPWEMVKQARYDDILRHEVERVVCHLGSRQ